MSVVFPIQSVSSIFAIAAFVVVSFHSTASPKIPLTARLQIFPFEDYLVPTCMLILSTRCTYSIVELWDTQNR